MKIYKVMQKFAGGKEQFSQDFKTVAEARDYATNAATENAAMKIKVIYNIYEFDELMETIDSEKLTSSSSPREDLLSGSGGKQSGSTFSPTPFATAPRPTGMPQNWKKDPNEDEKDKS